jgi:antitoxin (DNA-binding transcriptional repressor) of toxin-antitoxin stability system
MVRVSLDEMSRDPGRYIREVEAGETVVVTRADRAVAEIRPVAAGEGGDAKTLRPAGLAAGEFQVPDDFNDPLPPDVLDSFEGTSGH